MEVSTEAVRLTEKVIGLTKQAGQATRKFFWPRNDDFKTRLEELWSDVEARNIPRRIASERLSIILRDLLEAYRRSPESNYQEMMDQVVRGIHILADNTLGAPRVPYLYIRNLREAHIACEPCIELLESSVCEKFGLHSFLECADEITFYFTDQSYFDMLKKRFESISCAQRLIDKLKFKKIETKTTRPLFLFVTSDNRHHGMGGRFHPVATKTGDHFRLTEPLPFDWYTYLTEARAKDHFTTLTK